MEPSQSAVELGQEEFSDTILKIRQEPKVDYDENFTTLITIPISIRDQDQDTSQEKETVHESFLSKIFQHKKPRDFFNFFYALRPYLFDLLKTREGFDDFIQSLRSFINTYGDDAELSPIQNIINGLETRDLLILLLESCSPKSMSKLGEWLVTLFYPLPIFYSLPLPPTTNYGDNQNNRFRANLDCCSEVLIQNNKPLILSFGTKSASQKGKSSLLSYLSSTKDPEEFSPKSSFCHYGSIDLYCKTSEVEEKFMIADVHGCTAETNQSLESMILSLYKCSHVTLFHFIRDDLLTKDKENSDSNNNDSEILRFMKSDGMFSEMFLSSSAKPFLLLWRDFNQKTDSDLLGRIEKALKESCHSFSSSSYLGLVPVPDFRSFKGRELRTKKENTRKIIAEKMQKAITTNQDQSFSFINLIESFDFIRQESSETSKLCSATEREYFCLRLQEDSKMITESLKNTKDGNMEDQILCKTLFPFFWADCSITEKENELRSILYQFKENKSQGYEILQEIQNIKQKKNSFHLSNLVSLFNKILSTNNNIWLTNFSKTLNRWKNPIVASLKSEYLSIISQVCNLTKGVEEEKIKKMKQLENILYDKDITQDTFLDEIQSIYEFSPKTIDYQAIKSYYSRILNRGEPLNLINGKTLKLGSKLLSNIFPRDHNLTGKIFIISVIGVQSSAKSTLLNYLFGCGFTTSSGRCTKGLYMSLLKHSDGWFIIVIDTEGLLSVTTRDPEFDYQMAVMAFSCSHVVIVKNKGEMGTKLLDLLKICISALKYLRISDIKPKIVFALRDIAEVDPTISQEMYVSLKSNMERVAKSLEVDLNSVTDLNKDDIFLFPSAFYLSKDDKNVSVQINNQLFSKSIVGMRNHIFEYLASDYCQKHSVKDLGSFYTKAEKQWNKITQKKGDLVRSKSLLETELKDNARQKYKEIYPHYQDLFIKKAKEYMERIKKTLLEILISEQHLSKLESLLTNELNDIKTYVLELFEDDINVKRQEYKTSLVDVEELKNMVEANLEIRKEYFLRAWRLFKIDWRINKEAWKLKRSLQTTIANLPNENSSELEILERRKDFFRKEYDKNIQEYFSGRVNALIHQIQNHYECAAQRIFLTNGQKINVPTIAQVLKAIDPDYGISRSFKNLNEIGLDDIVQKTTSILSENSTEETAQEVLEIMLNHTKPASFGLPSNLESSLLTIMVLQYEKCCIAKWLSTSQYLDKWLGPEEEYLKLKISSRSQLQKHKLETNNFEAWRSKNLEDFWLIDPPSFGDRLLYINNSREKNDLSEYIEEMYSRK